MIPPHGDACRVHDSDRRPFTAGPVRRTGARSYAVPLVVAVTGHRDLVPAEVPQIQERVRDCLASCATTTPAASSP